MVKARKWVVVKHFEGTAQRSDLRIEEEELPPLKDGEFLAEAVYLSVDPYMRLYASVMAKLGDTMFGEQVAKIVESKNPDYAVGDYVTAMFGWRTHTIAAADNLKALRVAKINPALSQPKSTAIGMLGMPGATAYFGLFEILAPKEGQTLVVSGAAGAVGSIVGQLGKVKGCHVVGFAGSDAKVAHLKELGFDAAYNYKTISSIEQALKEACPKGIDMYFDNVGGEFFDTVIPMMNTFGRVAVCGQISSYNKTGPDLAPRIGLHMIGKQLKIEGFIVLRWYDRWQEAFLQMDEWIKEGKIKYRETVTEGFDNMFDAFAGLFKGDNTGKAIVKV